MSRSGDNVTGSGPRGTVLARSQELRLQARAVRTRAAAVRGQIHGRRRLPKLSRRESDVLGLLSSGLTTKDLAVQLGISVNTANYHIANVYRKLGAHSRVEAANAYFARVRGRY